MLNLNGLTKINVELSSVCLKQPGCWCCGRRKFDKEHGTQNYGYMDFSTVEKISKQTPDNIFIAFHWNGDPLHYERLGDAIKIFSHCTTYFVTNGMLLLEKSNEIIDNLDILSISILEKEHPETKIKQLEIIKQFLKEKGNKKPFTNLRFVGNIDDEEEYLKLNCLIARRTLHRPEGSYDYRKPPTIPEHGVCEDLLHNLAIDRFGNISICVRYDNSEEMRLGNINEMSLIEAWNSKKRLNIKNLHITGNRHLSGFCHSSCHFYGVPTG